MRKRYIIITLICLGFQVALLSQQETILTKYTFNSLFFNPAYAGSIGEDIGSFTLQYRNQWLGVDGAPNTILAGAEKSFFDHSVGLGLTVSHEGIGANKHSEFALNTNYKIKLDRGYIGGGIRSGLGIIYTDFSKLNVLEQGDVFETNAATTYNFNVGAGILYYDKSLQLGVSIPSLASVVGGNIVRKRHVYSHATIKIGDSYSVIKWVPSLLVKNEKAVPLQVTIGTQAWLNDVFAPGVHWRVGESLALSLELKLLEKLNLTAVYDFTTNDLNDYSNGSLEFMVAWKFGDLKNAIQE